MKKYTRSAIVSMSWLFAASAFATTYTVTNTGDNGGTNPAAHAGTGTLRQAIVDSNADGGAANEVHFAIAGAGPFTITVGGAGMQRLPAIASNLTIDGFTQAGATPNSNTPDAGGLNAQLMIEISGAGTGDTGFSVSGNVKATLSGLAINGFTGDAIDGEQNLTGGTLSVYGCYVGTQIDGSAYAGGFGNNGLAIRAGAGHANIGGVMPGQRNLISGNRAGGILVGGPIVVAGNLIGPDAGGTLPIGNGVSSNWPGIVVPGNVPAVTIGCSGAGCALAGHPSRNVISGNHEYGIGIWDTYGQGSGGLEIKGNFIGTDWSGTMPLPNGDATGGCPTYCGGIQLQGSPSTATPASIIGGFVAGEGNLIAYNAGPGIVGYGGAIGASFDNQGNAIHRNQRTDIAFDLSAGRVANDAGDADAGTNKQQNFPVIQSAAVVGGNLDVTYAVDSAAANATYPLRVDFYAAIGNGSGEYLGSDTYAIGSAQASRFVSLPLPGDALPLVGVVVTATDANGYTSEFSPALVFDRLFADPFGG